MAMVRVVAPLCQCDKTDPIPSFLKTRRTDEVDHERYQEPLREVLSGGRPKASETKRGGRLHTLVRLAEVVGVTTFVDHDPHLPERILRE